MITRSMILIKSNKKEIENESICKQSSKNKKITIPNIKQELGDYEQEPAIKQKQAKQKLNIKQKSHRTNLKLCDYESYESYLQELYKSFIFYILCNDKTCSECISKKNKKTLLNNEKPLITNIIELPYNISLYDMSLNEKLKWYDYGFKNGQDFKTFMLNHYKYDELKRHQVDIFYEINDVLLDEFLDSRSPYILGLYHGMQDNLKYYGNLYKKKNFYSTIQYQEDLVSEYNMVANMDEYDEYEEDDEDNNDDEEDNNDDEEDNNDDEEDNNDDEEDDNDDEEDDD